MLPWRGNETQSARNEISIIETLRCLPADRWEFSKERDSLVARRNPFPIYIIPREITPRRRRACLREENGCRRSCARTRWWCTRRAELGTNRELELVYLPRTLRRLLLSRGRKRKREREKEERKETWKNERTDSRQLQRIGRPARSEARSSTIRSDNDRETT